MIIDMVEVVTTYNRYWVADNEGKQHLFLDRLAAQLYEENVRRLAREAALGQKIDVNV